MEANALRQRRWTIAAIARHLGHDRKTVRAYLRGDRTAGERQRSEAGQLAPFAAYLQARFDDNAHIWQRVGCCRLAASDGDARVAAATWRSTRRRTASRLSRRPFGPGNTDRPRPRRAC